MWSLYNSLDIGRKALSAQQAGLQVASNNIANVNTPGYHRQHAVFEATTPEETYAGQIGTGVQVGSIESARDRFLESRIGQALQNTGKQQAVVDHLGQVESAFPPNSPGLQEGISRFFNSFSALATDATSSSLRYGVISAAENMAATFRSLSGRLADTRASANAAVADTVGEINSRLSTIARLNQQIVESEVGGSEASTLRDQRSEALNQLSSSLDIHYYEDSDGSVSITTASGSPLVTASFSTTLSFNATPPNGFYEIRSGNADLTSTTRGGTLGGLLEVRDRTIPAYQRDLDILAQSIITEVNTLHQGGTDLQAPPTATSLNLFNPAAVVAGAAASFSVNSVVASDIRYLAAGQSGAPGDNANATALAGLAFQKVLAGGTQDFADAFGALQFKVGIDQQSAVTQLDTENALLTQLSNSRDSFSGVSLDEEAVDLIRFQRAYQAASRFISIIDDLTGDLIQNLGS